MKMSKKPARQHAIAPHPKEKPRSPEAARKPAAQRGQDQNRSHGLKHRRTAYTAAYIHKCRFKIGKGVPIRPNALSKIHFNTAEDASKDTDKNCRKQYVA